MRPLKDIAKEITSALSASACGPLVAASLVVELSSSWSSYEAEADGASLHTWLRKTCGKGRGLAWWSKRDEAVKQLGEAIRRRLDHDVAVWVANTVPVEYRRRCVEELMAGYRANGSNPLSMAQATRIIYPIIGKKTRSDWSVAARVVIAAAHSAATDLRSGNMLSARHTLDEALRIYESITKREDETDMAAE